MGIRALTAREATVAEQLAELKDEAGSHWPSPPTLRDRVPDLEVGVDACFIPNPCAIASSRPFPPSAPNASMAICSGSRRVDGVTSSGSSRR